MIVIDTKLKNNTTDEKLLDKAGREKEFKKLLKE